MKRNYTFGMLAAAAVVAVTSAGAAVYQRAGSSAAPRHEGIALDSEQETMSRARMLSQFQQGPSATTKAISFTADLPFEIVPTEEEVNTFTIIDANEDNNKWGYQSNFRGLVSPTPRRNYPSCDDWAITPGLRFTASDKNYEFAFDVKQNMCGDEWLTSVEFYIGTAPTVEAMTTKIGEMINWHCQERNTPEHMSFPFGLPGEAGTYYIGMRCISDDDTGWPGTFNNISVKEMDSSALAPAMVTDAVVTPGTNGALTANVAFTMPSKTMNGKDIPASSTLTATVVSPAETKTVTGAPGAAVSVDVATNQGNNDLTLTVSGQADGEPLPLSVYTGVVLPMRVHGLTGTLSPDNLSYTLTWTPPTEGENGGYVDFNAIEYDVYIQNGDKYDLLASVGKNLTYTYTMEQGDKLRTVRLKVLSRNAAGTSTDDINWIDQDAVTVSDMVGTPYALPAEENFDGQDMKYTPITIQYPTDDYHGRWMLSDPSGCVPDDNQSALMAYNPFSDDATKGRVALPKFSTKGINNAAFSIKAMRYGSYATKMYVYARTYTTDLTLLGTIDCSTQNDWFVASYPLPAQFQNQEWVQMIVDVDLDDVDYVYAIDSYSLKSSADNDLGITEISAPAGAEAGAETQVVAKIANNGFSSLAPKIRFSAEIDGIEIAAREAEGQQLASGATTILTWNFVPASQYIGKTVTLKATMLTPDEIPANNVALCRMDVRRPALPVVTDLAAANTPEGVDLTWSAPAAERLVAESFENEEDFSYDEDIAGFTNYDGDGKSVYKFENNAMPNERLPKAFMVINQNGIESSDGLEGHTGVKYLMATCPEMLDGVTPDPANDWLISPAAVGDTYVSFYFDIINERYPETIRLMASSTDAQPGSFTEISRILKNKKGWELVEFKLPAGTKYFAVNYVSRDMFGVLVDDIRYFSAADLHTITGYKVYRNGQFLANVTGCGYKDTTAAEGSEYTYHVTALTPEEGIASNQAVITASSAIDAVGADAVDAPADVYTPSGVLVARGITRAQALSQLPAGVYIHGTAKLYVK